MEWYYVEAGRQAGPVSQEQLNDLVASGKVQPSTLVWRPGMQNWVPHLQARPATSSNETAVAVAPVPGPTAEQVVCSECKNAVSRDQALPYGAMWVCALCKPLFIQKVKEGAIEFSPTALVYAGFWIRFLAKMIDGIIQSVFLMIPMIIVTVYLMRNAAAPGSDPTTLIWLQVIYQLVALVFGVGYSTFFLGKWGATPGKMVCGLKVVKADGTPLTYLRSLGRAGAEYVNMFTLSVGYIIAAFDVQKRGLHDHICNTRVVKIR